MRSQIAWLRALALLPVGCSTSEVATKTPATESVPATAEPTTSAVAPTPSGTAATPAGCFCRRHKSDSQISQGRPWCKIGEPDYEGIVCTPGNPAEGPLPPPDLPAARIV